MVRVLDSVNMKYKGRPRSKNIIDKRGFMGSVQDFLAESLSMAYKAPKPPNLPRKRPNGKK